MKKNNNVVTVGLVEGRHEMPVSSYIFKSINNVLNFTAIDNTIINFLETKVGIHTTYGFGLNQNDYTDVEIFEGKKELVVYVTGLTAATASLVKLCAMNGVRLTLKHYDREQILMLHRESFKKGSAT